MGKLARVDMKIFGSSGGTTEFGQFGSDAAGSALTTKDIATIQALSQYAEGWYSATASLSEPPRGEDMNGLFLLITTQLRYLLQTGVAEWSTDQDYYIGSRVQIGGVIFQSKTGTDGSPNTGNNPATDITNWGVKSENIPGDLFLSLVQDPVTLGVRALILTGQVITIANYAELVSNTYIGDANNANTAYQYFYKCSDSGGTTRSTSGAYFKLPDFRGVFLRGLDLGATRNPNGATDFLGNYRADAMQGHYHQFTSYASGGAPVISQSTYGGVGTTAAGPVIGNASAFQTWQILGPSTDGTNGTPRIDKETRSMQGVIQIGIRY